MDALKLRFPNLDRDELPLGVGMHGIGPDASGRTLGLLDDDRQPAVRFCVDRRGVWLTVAEGARGVHVNGRQVRRMAMLRVGDAIYVDGIEMCLVSDRRPAALSSLPTAGAQDGDGDPRVVLRGVGGQHHGRSFTLARPRLIGSASDADIRIDDPAFAERHARIELLGEHVVLRDIGSAEGSLVNGEAVRDAVLQPGDQIVFDAHHRFVIEAPARAMGLRNLDDDDPGNAASPEGMAPEVADSGDGSHRLPWLLLAALLLASLLSALLLFGAA